jgi:hypothetical protein
VLAFRSTEASWASVPVSSDIESFSHEARASGTR